MYSYLAPLALTLAACFGIQSLTLHKVGGRMAKSESNFFSSLGRIQAGAHARADVMVLGSSITGRLPDRAQGFAGVANMGCDGGSAVDALRAMDQGILPTAPWIIIEANTLQLALDAKPTEIGIAMQQPWFKAGLKIPCVAAYARPAAFFYSKLLARKIGGFERASSDANLGATSRPKVITAVGDSSLAPGEVELIDKLCAVLGRLKTKGCQTMIVWLPPTRRDASPPPTWILELARRSESPWWDLGQDAAPGTVTLTDGVHMAAPSAARTVVSLMKSISGR